MSALLNFFVFFTPIYSRAMQDPAGWISWLFALFLAISMALALYSIFKFKNRHTQLWWVRLGTLFQVASLAAAIAILLTLGGIGSFLMKEALSVLLLFLAIIAYWQAGRCIKKDQELVDSMDRIR